MPTIVQLELAKWLPRKTGEDKANQVMAFTETCVIADLDTAIALSAADLDQDADRGVGATAAGGALENRAAQLRFMAAIVASTKC